jgi:hypothetical protein
VLLVDHLHIGYTKGVEMNVPSVDHAGWGLLLAAVMENDSVAAGVQRNPEPKVDAIARIQRRERNERKLIRRGETEVYA